MLTVSSVAARSSIIGLFLAAIFATNARAADSSLTNLETGLNDLIYRLSRSIVTVEAGSRLAKVPSRFPGQESWRTVVSSGLVVDSAGDIVVAAEPITGQEQLTVIFDNDRLPARLVGIDYHNDIALLKVDHPIGQAITLSEQHTCAGQMIIGMGNAYGMRVSPSIGFCAGARDDGRLQFSLPLTSGAIGGGVFDLSGDLIGVLVGSMGRTEQVALAVPAYRVTSSIEYLKAYGDHHAGFLGLTVGEIAIDPPISTRPLLSMTGGVSVPSVRLNAGLLVTSLYAGGPADRAGIRMGDVLFAVGNHMVATSAELSSIARQLEPGMTVNVELLRGGERLSVPVVVGKRAVAANSSSTMDSLDRFETKQALTDSLSRTLEYFKREVRRLESKLNSID